MGLLIIAYQVLHVLMRTSEASTLRYILQFMISKISNTMQHKLVIIISYIMRENYKKTPLYLPVNVQILTLVSDKEIRLVVLRLLY